MITLSILATIIFIIGIAIVVFAAGFLAVFGDIIIAITVIVVLVKILKRTKKNTPVEKVQGEVVD